MNPFGSFTAAKLCVMVVAVLWATLKSTSIWTNRAPDHAASSRLTARRYLAGFVSNKHPTIISAHTTL
ncbi:hypothetical protein EYR36_007435 [Pleurotus pulmonarius]|nr:hypothetical protein EYR36_007435 [Pleurotus pulmonarius]